MATNINDMRKQKEFSGITFSKYKKSEAKKQLLKMINDNDIEAACYWCGEFVCAGHFLELWEIIFKIMGNNIHIGNPKLPLYINKKIDEFKEIVVSGYLDSELNMRNNNRIRQIFCEVICILCLSRKKTTFDVQKISPLLFDMTNLKGHLKAPSVNYGRGAFTSDDPNELFIAVNELTWHIKNKNSYKAFFWIEWIIDFEEMCKKKKISLVGKNRNYPVPEKNRKDVIWITWNIILNETQKIKNKNKLSIIKSLLNIFCLRYTHPVRKRRRYLIYFAISLLTEPINIEQNIINDTSIVRNALLNIDKIYAQIKKNEVAPKTDYLFGNLKNDKDKNIKKIQGMNNLVNIIIRK